MRLIQPVASRGVAWLAARGIDPLHVVLAHGTLGFAAAVLLAVGARPALALAGLLLIGKILLDNMDGGLARATGRVTIAGRYLDTLVDFFGNAAIFAALTLHGPAGAALAAFVVLTLVLSFDYNVERRYREARGATPSPEAVTPSIRPGGASSEASGAPDGVVTVLRGVYGAIFQPQDAAVERLDRSTGRAVARRSGAPFDADARLAWNDLASTAWLVNLGLSTQLTILALLLLLGAPFAWVWLVLLQAPYVVCIWLLRAARFAAYLRTR